MYKIATLILVLYVIASIMRRSTIRERESKRLKRKVDELTRIVEQLNNGQSAAQVSEAMLEFQIRDIRSQFEELEVPMGQQKKTTFEQLHFVEGRISKSTFVPLELAPTVESTMYE